MRTVSEFTLKLVRSIKVSLPAPSIGVITERVNGLMEMTDPDLLEITRDEVAYGISYIRTHASDLSWTIPHVRRGKTVDSDNRFQMKPLDPEETSYEEIRKTYRGMLEGVRGSVEYTRSLAQNSVVGTKAYLHPYLSAARRRQIKQVVSIFEFAISQMEGLAQDIADDLNSSESA